jgi:hypothetical protein
VTFEDLRKVLRERAAGHDDVGARFLRLLLQFPLHMRQVTDQADALQFVLALELGNQIERLNRVVVFSVFIGG